MNAQEFVVNMDISYRDGSGAVLDSNEFEMVVKGGSSNTNCLEAALD
jgi:hypothetical protein